MTSPSQFGSSGSYVPPGYGVTPSGSAAPGEKNVLPENLRTAIVVVGSLAAVMVIVQVVNWAMGYRLDQFGIEPRSWSGSGVLTAPLIHGSWGHLWSNLVPLVIMGVLITVGGLRQFFAVTVLVWLVSWGSGCGWSPRPTA
ncbi:MAG: rhomboid family intramembrane serine protease [Luteolibacter sp.]